MRKFDEKQSAQKGSLMVEAIAMLGLITMVTPILYKKAAERTTELQDINVATQMRMISSATDDYIKDNYNTLADRADGNGNFSLSVDDISNYLPKGFNLNGNEGGQGSTKMFDNIGIQVNDRVVAPGTNHEQHIYTTAVLASPRDALPRTRSSKIASMIGANGGVVQGNNATGVQGSWQSAVTDYGFAARADGAHDALMIISTEAINSPKGDVNSQDVLYRNNSRGAEGRTMTSELIMGGNPITDVTSLIAAAGQSVTIGNNAGNGNLIVRGTTTLQNAVTINNGNLSLQSGNVSVQGNYSGSGWMSVGGNFTTGGSATVANGLTVNGGGAGIIGNVNVQGDYGSPGSINIGQNLTLAGTTTLGYGGATVRGGGLTVQAGGANITGTSKFHNDVQIEDSAELYIAPGGQIYDEGNLWVGDYADIGGDLYVNGDIDANNNLSVGNTLTVSGSANFYAPVTVGTNANNKNLTVYGSVNANGIGLNNGNFTVASNGNVTATGTITANKFATPYNGCYMDQGQIKCYIASLGGGTSTFYQEGVSIKPYIESSFGVNGRSALAVQSNYMNMTPMTSVGYSAATGVNNGRNSFNFFDTYATYKDKDGKIKMIADADGIAIGYDMAREGTMDIESGDYSDQTFINTARGVINLSTRNNVAASNNDNFIRGRRFVSDVGSHPFAYAATDAGYVDSLDNPYEDYEINPAYTSVMNDIKLASRGGARLSDILPDYINKGVYVVDNSYSEAGIEGLGSNASNGFPKIAFSNAANRSDFTIAGKTMSNFDSTSSYICSVAGPSCQASPWLGFIPAPSCPPGYDMAITVNPFRWRMAETYVVAQDPLPSNSSANKPNIRANFESYFARNTDPSSSVVEAIDVMNADGASGTAIYGSVPTFSYQVNTWFNSSLVAAYNGCNEGTGCESANKDVADFMGWHALMGFVYRGGEYRQVLEGIGETVSDDTFYWNLFPVYAGDIAGYATTYCAFNRYDAENDSWVFGSEVPRYDQLNHFRGYGKKDLGSATPNDPDLGYDDIW